MSSDWDGKVSLRAPDPPSLFPHICHAFFSSDHSSHQLLFGSFPCRTLIHATRFHLSFLRPFFHPFSPILTHRSTSAHFRFSPCSLVQASAELVALYSMELVLREAIVGDLAGADRRERQVLYLSTWLQQPYLTGRADPLFAMLDLSPEG